MKLKTLELAVLFLLLGAILPLCAQEESPGGGEAGETGAALEEDFYDDDIPVMEDEGVTIVSARETTQQMETLTREEIEKFHAADIPALLEEALGLGLTRYGPYGSMAEVSIRGFDTERIAVLVDGLPVNSTRSGDFDFNSIDINSIEKIEVVYGGSDAKYNVSGALGGVINIVTIKKQRPGWNIGGIVSNGSYLPGTYNKQYGGIGAPHPEDMLDTQKLSFGGSYGADNYSFKANIFGNRAGNHFLYRDDYDYARRKEGNEIWDMGASASFLREFEDLSRLILSGDFYYGDKHIPASGYTAEYAKENDFSTRQNLMFDMPRAFRDDLSMELSLGNNTSILDYDPGSEPSRHNEYDLSLINRWGWYPLEKVTLRFGGDYRFIYLDSTNDGIHKGNRTGLYLTTEYAPVERLLLMVSLKGVSDNKTVVPVPKFGVSWRATEALTLRNNYFRSFKFPDFDDLYWEQAGYTGNPDLKPEDGWGADLSAEFSYRDLLKFDSALYGEWTEDSIHWNNTSGYWRPENISAGVFVGWDNKLKIFLPLSLKPLEKPIVSLSWKFQSSWLLNEGLGFSDNIRIPYLPVHILGFSLELPWKTGSFTLSGRFESSRYADTANLMELAPYFILNSNVNQRLNKNLTLFGSLNNILNTHYVSFADYPMPGIGLSMGLKLQWEEK